MKIWTSIDGDFVSLEYVIYMVILRCSERRNSK
nr:MAG TPA: hypothetical protein [Caudoviricetes sp.]